MIKKYIFSLFVVSFLSITNAWGATLYFDDSVTGDQDWGNMGNWWTDNISTIQAGSLPSVSDDVVIKSIISTNSGAPISVHSIIINDGFGISGISITVVNGAIFNGSSTHGGTITGDVTFNGSASNNGTITGGVTFNGSGGNMGIILGLATFNGTSINDGTVTNAIFNFNSSNGSSMNYTSTITGGSATFNGSATNWSPITNGTFNNNSKNYSDVTNGTFNDNSSNSPKPGYGPGDGWGWVWTAIFNDNSGNSDYIGNGTFNDNSGNSGTIGGNADVYYPSPNPIWWTVVGIVTYHGSWIIPPTITAVSSDKSNGIYTVGDVIDIDVIFSEAVTSTGNVTVTLETWAIDHTCTFTVTSSTTGTCNYTIQLGDTTADLTVASISGVILDADLTAMVNFTPSTNFENKDIAISRTLYFNGAANSSWSTLANWWQNSNYTIQAASLPTIIDNVIIRSTLSSIDPGTYPADRSGLTFNTYPSVNNLTLSGLSYGIRIMFVPTVGVVELATFDNYSSNEWIIHGDALFEGSSQNYGTITWDATFNDSCSSGIVLGFSYFNGPLALSPCSTGSFYLPGERSEGSGLVTIAEQKDEKQKELIEEVIETKEVEKLENNLTQTSSSSQANQAQNSEPFDTRENTLNIVLKFSGVEVNGMYICRNKFTDTPTPYSCEIAEKAQTAGIISKERETFEPERPVTRIEAYAIFMKSICVAPETNENNWQKLIIKKAIELGLTTRTIENFRPNRPISTSEMFALAQKIGQWKTNNPNSCQNK